MTILDFLRSLLNGSAKMGEAVLSQDGYTIRWNGDHIIFGYEDLEVDAGKLPDWITRQLQSV